MTTIDLTGQLTSSCLQLITQTKYAYPTSGVGRDSSVGIATRYGLYGLGIEARRGGGRDFPALRTISLLYNGYRVFLGGKAAGAWR
jgi:hypothetical protein